MKRVLSIVLSVMIVLSLTAHEVFADKQNGISAQQSKGESLTVTAGNSPKTGKITLSWATVDGAMKYEVYRSDTRAGEYTRRCTTTKLGYTDTSSNAGYKYFYIVKALDSKGKAVAASSIVSRYADCAAPVITAGNNASNGKVKLKWEKIAGAGKYEVYRAESKNGDYVRVYTTGYSTYTDTASKPNHTYYYKVAAISSKTAEANSAASNIAERTCDCAAPTVTASNNTQSGKIVLKWKTVDGAGKYEIYRATNKNGTYSKYSTTSRTTYTNTSTYAGYTYYYKVKAISAVSSYGNSAFGNVVSRTCDCGQITNCKLGYTDEGKVIFSWGKASGATSYKVYRAGTKNGSYKLLAETKDTKFTDKTASAGYYYFYKIVAVSSKSSYADSSAYCVKALTVLPAVKNLHEAGTKKQTALKWDPVNGAAGYLIYRGSVSARENEMRLVGEVSTNAYYSGSIDNAAKYSVVAYKYRSDNAVVLSKPKYISINHN